jgi:transcriptional regulator with XRE-family HTH domain
VGRHKTRITSIGDAGPEWRLRYRCEWGLVVGSRVRRLRQNRGLRLVDLAQRVTRPDGGNYSIGFVSRLERGWASPPLWVYIRIAEELATEPGLLLGPDAAGRPATEAELMLLSVLRELGMTPEEAIARLARSFAPR